MRARTVADVRAALLNNGAVGPLMGGGVVLLLAAGISMIYAGGFGWSPPWIGIVFLITIFLAVVGPANNGRRMDAMHAMAAKAADGPLPAEIENARSHGLLHYGVWMGTLEMVAALFIMTVKPDAAIAGAAAIAAALAALIPARMGSREGTHTTPAEA
jgi:hypothetical protein